MGFVSTHDRRKMNKPDLAIVVLALLALDWAALHDIVKGEASLYHEVAMVGSSFMVFAVIVQRALRRKRAER